MEVKIVKTRKSNNWYKNLEATLKLSVQFCHNLSDPSPIKLLGPKIGNGKLISASKLKDSIRFKKAINVSRFESTQRELREL